MKNRETAGEGEKGKGRKRGKKGKERKKKKKKKKKEKEEEYLPPPPPPPVAAAAVAPSSSCCCRHHCLPVVAAFAFYCFCRLACVQWHLFNVTCGFGLDVDVQCFDDGEYKDKEIL
eukprot:TRINITY_DN2486_c0_g1_i6.p2 TRINITY_DN2486_c0_g1~~TRINITY_DN2486_c0_g1_i6.p2  ORF type:complete len:116 (-),score=52.60 TRINITY_DN2486_c0_g1_i6:501-848(-)